MADQKTEPVLTLLIHSAYVSSIQKIAIPSLSYEPATEREMYPGTTAIMAAATSPAPASCRETTWGVQFTRCGNQPRARVFLWLVVMSTGADLSVAGPRGIP